MSLPSQQHPVPILNQGTDPGASRPTRSSGPRWPVTTVSSITPPSPAQRHNTIADTRWCRDYRHRPSVFVRRGAIRVARHRGWLLIWTSTMPTYLLTGNGGVHTDLTLDEVESPCRRLGCQQPASEGCPRAGITRGSDDFSDSGKDAGESVGLTGFEPATSGL